jgi:hypothetical protein
MKQKEYQLMEWLERRIERTITPASNQYSDYDCETDNAIIELKVRDTFYPTKMIELDKMVRCLEIAKEKGKTFVYVVQDPKGVYYLDITKNSSDILKTPASKIMCPKTTEFSNNNKIGKLVYNINMTKL